MKQISICFCILFSLSSCTKLGKTHRIKGKVLNPITGEGIEGVEIRMYKNKLGLANGSKKQKSVVTDQNGDFDMSKLAFRTDLLSVYSYPGEYYPIGWTNNQGESFEQPVLKMGKTIHADFYAVPYGKLQRHIQNVNCFNSTDKIEMFFDGAEVNDNTYSVGFMTSISGCIDITTSPLKISIGKKYFHWVVTKNNVSNTYYDTIVVTENNIAVLNIFY